ncbi:MAG: hypothetical protein SF162_15930 [bacterium]|nr:hypothetical protein [bacterium]
MSDSRPLNDTDFELLSAYVDGALSDSERQALERRLHTEAALRAELDALRQTLALIKALPLVRAPRSYALTPEMVGLGTAPAKPPIPFPFTAWFSAVSAAAAVILVVIGVSFFTGRSQNLNSASTPGDADVPSTIEIAMLASPMPDQAAAMTDESEAMRTQPEAQTAESAPLGNVQVPQPTPTLDDALRSFEAFAPPLETFAGMPDSSALAQMEEAFLEDAAGGQAGGVGGGANAQSAPAGAGSAGGETSPEPLAPPALDMQQGMPTVTPNPPPTLIAMSATTVPTAEALPTLPPPTMTAALTASPLPEVEPAGDMSSADDAAADSSSENAPSVDRVSPNNGGDIFGLVLIGAGLTCFALAGASTLARRRLNRQRPS